MVRSRMRIPHIALTGYGVWKGHAFDDVSYNSKRGLGLNRISRAAVDC